MFDMAKCEFNSQVVVPIEYYTKLVKKEIQLELLKKMLKSKCSYNNYVDITDLLILLGIEKTEGGATGE